MKSLRLKNHWSQEQLAQFSGLNVRTIQRVEKGNSVGLESLKAIAAVFKLSTNELLQAIESDKQLSEPCVDDPSNEELLKTKALEKAKSIKSFYILSAFLVAIFLLLMLPNYNGGENLGPLVVVFLSFAVMIALYAYAVFEPFGEKWEQNKAAKILKDENNS